MKEQFYMTLHVYIFSCKKKKSLCHKHLIMNIWQDNQPTNHKWMNEWHWKVSYFSAVLNQNYAQNIA